MDTYLSTPNVVGTPYHREPDPTTEPFATCVAAISRDFDHPEAALRNALEKIAEQRHARPETIFAIEARRHGYASSSEFERALLPAIKKRRHQIDAHDIFCEKAVEYAR
jgi:hypothetical protein